MVTRAVDDDNGFRMQGVMPASSSNTSSRRSSNGPGKRTKNPLGYFSSFNYQLSLYMITPDAYDAFVQSGRKDINSLNNVEGNQTAGALLIAQSGGINNTTSKRAPGFNLDYYIDNLSLKTYTGPKQTGSESNTTTVRFQIIEPYGFSFITKLKLASEEIKEYSKSLGNSEYVIQNPSKHFFVLGIKFLGYDENGNIMTGNKVYDGNQLDRNLEDSSAIFDRYYDILITGIKFKIDGNATTYNIEASSVAPRAAFGVKRGMIKTNTTITAANVSTAITTLLGRFNTLEEDLKKNGAIEHPNFYEAIYAGDGAADIETATVDIPEDYLPYNWEGSQAQNTTQSTIAVEASADPNNKERQITFKNDTPIIQAISQIISQSSYLRDALIKVYENNLQATSGTYAGKPTDSSKSVAWFNISAKVENPKWDSIRKDFAYNIKYYIQRYETPIIQSIYSNNGVNYYGPHKIYEYWYSGKNSEIISYEQTLNNAYFTVDLSDVPIGKTESTENDSTSGREPMQNASAVTNTGSIGPQGKAAQNNYLTSLFDPGSFATAKITILGDPDFLAQDSPGSIDELYSRFYGDDGFTINPAGGQVFIEISFKEAIDLDYEKGYLDINDRILFWKYPDAVAEQIKGIIYMVTSVDSTFAGGSFKQVLNCNIETLGEFENERPNQRTPDTEIAPTTPTTGLQPDVFNAVPQFSPAPVPRAAYPGLPLRQPAQDD
jgi:hypothetical protein